MILPYGRKHIVFRQTNILHEMPGFAKPGISIPKKDAT